MLFLFHNPILSTGGTSLIEVSKNKAQEIIPNKNQLMVVRSPNDQGEDPGNRSLPTNGSYSSQYCSTHGRPSADIPHFQFSMPYPDESFSDPDKLPLLRDAGRMDYYLTVGKPYTFKYRFKSELLYFPGGIHQGSYRIPGYEDQYPILENYACSGATSGFEYPFSGVITTIWQGDSGSSSIAGFKFLTSPQPNNLPPFNSSYSGVSGFSYTPLASQAGKTMVLKVVSQCGVTLQERESNIFESDQATYTLYLHISASLSPSIETLESKGLYGNITLSCCISENTLNVDPSMTRIVSIKYYMDDTFLGDGLIGAQLLYPRSPNTVIWPSSLSFDSRRLPDGEHHFYVVARNAQGNAGYSAAKTLWIENHPNTGPTPSFIVSHQSGPRPGESINHLTVPLVDGYNILAVNIVDSNGNLIVEGRPVYAPLHSGQTQPSLIMWDAVAPPTLISGTSIHAVVYYGNDLIGISPTQVFGN